MATHVQHPSQQEAKVQNQDSVPQKNENASDELATVPSRSRQRRLPQHVQKRYQKQFNRTSRLVE